jgi:hypothetical protein
LVPVGRLDSEEHQRGVGSLELLGKSLRGGQAIHGRFADEQGGLVRPHGEPGSQCLLGSLVSQRDQSHLSRPRRLLRPEGGLDGELVVGTHDELDPRGVDGRATFTDTDSCLGVGHAFYAHDDIQRTTPFPYVSGTRSDGADKNVGDGSESALAYPFPNPRIPRSWPGDPRESYITAPRMAKHPTATVPPMRA